MDTKLLLQKIKQIVFESTDNVEETPVKVELMEVKTQDGKIIMVDKLEVGGVCTMDGNPLPDGEYILEDLSALEVTGGVITEIKAPEVATPEVEMNEDKPVEKTELEIANEKIASLEREIATLKFAVQDKDVMIEKIKTELSETPATEPIKMGAEKQEKTSPEMEKYLRYKKSIGL